MVNIKKLHMATKLPVLALTHEKPDLDEIHEALKNLPDSEERWKLVLEAGEIHEVINRGTKIYVEISWNFT